ISATAAVIAQYDGAQDQLTNFFNISGDANSWRAPGTTPISPTTAAYTDSGYAAIYGFIGAPDLNIAAISGNQPDDRISVSDNNTGGTPHAGLIAPMFLPTEGATFTGSFDSANITPRGAGSSAGTNIERRLTVQVV